MGEKKNTVGRSNTPYLLARHHESKRWRKRWRKGVQHRYTIPSIYMVKHGAEVDVQAVPPLGIAGRIQTEGRGGKTRVKKKGLGQPGEPRRNTRLVEVPPGREWSVGGTLNLRATASRLSRYGYNAASERLEECCYEES